MCGIAGVIVKRNNPQWAFDKLREAAKLMQHRGPDYNSALEYDNVMLIHYRLSIIDLDSRSNQPFTSAHKKHVTVYNGEVYNFQELRKEYDINSRTTSDTEIMLETFVQDGRKAVSKWNGIFAAAILDRELKKLHLIRDRFGVKPLYYFEDEKLVLFASEAKVIYKFLDRIEIDEQGLVEYLWYGNTISTHTIVKGVKKLSPATIRTFDLIKYTVTDDVYWANPGTSKLVPTEDEAIGQIKELLNNAVCRQLISDVPIGILLSGGIDSSAIVAFASQHSHKSLDTYSIEYDFNIGGVSELPMAAKVAKKYNTNHHELKATVKDISNIFEELVFQYDEPFADAGSIPLYLLSKACSQNKKVILQGDGGDEIFGGYRRYNVLDWLPFWKRISKWSYPFIPNTVLHDRMKRMSFLLNQQEDALIMSYYLSQDVEENSPLNILSLEFNRKLSSLNPFAAYFNVNELYKKENIVQRMLYADFDILLPNTYLEKVDKTTMKCSLESRVPFLDNDLVDYVLALPSKMKVNRGQKKYLLRKALKGIVSNEILDGGKRGFDVPYKYWLKEELYNIAKDSIESLPKEGILDKIQLSKILECHKKGEGNFGPLLWKSLVLIYWLDIYKNKISYNSNYLVKSY